MASPYASEFSFRSREEALRRFTTEHFDLLVIGGGITGASVARDAASRGLKVALVEKHDFAWGTSSRSSKLIHGGLRYLENLEFGLVSEALSERALLLKMAPHMVRPLPFYFPVYQGDPPGKFQLGMGMWLYDLLAMFRTPEFHRSLSTRKLLAEIPFLRQEKLKGGFRYSDASMWDDALTVQILRSAHSMGAAIANYCEANAPLYGENRERIAGMRVRDLESSESPDHEIDLHATQTIVCAGPWTDLFEREISPGWRNWLMPSKGVHLVFNHARLPVPGALVMNHPEDGRIAFVIPRPDYGAGVTIVGTTDGPSPNRPEDVGIDHADVEYLLQLLHKYFPDLKLGEKDIISAYVGIRPLMAPNAPGEGGALQKVSREHHIGDGPGGSVVVAGGKYTTSRRIGQEVVDYAIRAWKRAHRGGQEARPLPPLGRSNTKKPINPFATREAMARANSERVAPRELVERYGAEARAIADLAKQHPTAQASPPGFPELAAQLRHALRTEMVLHLEDFYLRRVPLFLAREDHGLPWASEMARAWAEERGLSASEAEHELTRLHSEVERRNSWKSKDFPSLSNK